MGREGGSKQVDSKFFPPKETRTTTSMHSSYIQCFFMFGLFQVRLVTRSCKFEVACVFFLRLATLGGMIALKKR